MAWTTPKTDWKITIINGKYSGDYFNYTDYNRIKGNIEYLAQIPLPNVDIDDMGTDKGVGDMIHSREFNAFERNLDLIGKAVGYPYLDYPAFADNGNTPTFEDLNQIESFTFTLYDILNDNDVYAVDTDDEYAVDTDDRMAVAEAEDEGE